MPSESSRPGPTRTPTLPTPPVQASAQRQAAPPFRPRKGSADTFPQELIKGLLSLTSSGVPVHINLPPQAEQDQATVMEKSEAAGRPGGSPGSCFLHRHKEGPRG